MVEFDASPLNPARLWGRISGMLPPVANLIFENCWHYYLARPPSVASLNGLTSAHLSVTAIDSKIASPSSLPTLVISSAPRVSCTSVPCQPPASSKGLQRERPICSRRHARWQRWSVVIGAWYSDVNARRALPWAYECAVSAAATCCGRWGDRGFSGMVVVADVLVRFAHVVLAVLCGCTNISFFLYALSSRPMA